MGKLYVITCLFNASNHQFQLFWLPDRYCFTYGEPRSITPESELRNALVEAESHARSTLGIMGMNVPFQLRPVEVTFLNGRIMASTPAEREWVKA